MSLFPRKGGPVLSSWSGSNDIEFQIYICTHPWLHAHIDWGWKCRRSNKWKISSLYVAIGTKRDNAEWPGAYFDCVSIHSVTIGMVSQKGSMFSSSFKEHVLWLGGPILEDESWHFPLEAGSKQLRMNQVYPFKFTYKVPGLVYTFAYLHMDKCWTLIKSPFTYVLIRSMNCIWTFWKSMASSRSRVTGVWAIPIQRMFAIQTVTLLMW